MKVYSLLLFLFFMSSCSRPFIAPPEQTTAYCNLLHIPEAPISHKARTFLGITFNLVNIEAPPAPYKCNTFVLVEGVIKNSPAIKAGLKEKDIILSVNKRPVCENIASIDIYFKKMIENQSAGSVAMLEVMRNKDIFSIAAELEEKPHSQHPEANYQLSKECHTPSLLETAFKKDAAGKLFTTIIDGLYQQSDTILNPDWNGNSLLNPFQLKEMTYILRHPLQAGEVGRRLSGRLLAITDKDNMAMPEIISNLTTLIDIEVRPSLDNTEVTFPNLVAAFKETNKKIEDSLKNLSQEEKTLLREKALRPWEDSQWNRILDISLRIDLKELFEAFNPVLHFLTSDNLITLKKDLLERFEGNNNPILYEELTPFGKVIVGGTGPNIYTEDAALILDLGGDDIYLNNAGGTRPNMNAALVIDWGGNDIYHSRDNFTQGAGVLGIGALIDLAGNDTFVSPDGSQGAGFWGLGILHHKGGDSSFSARTFSQGVGQMGIGYLWNGSGDDIYLCSEYGQGLGLFHGAGILIDRAGNDYCKLGGLEPDFRDPSNATVSMGQGFGKGIRPDKDKLGVSGGIGMLIDQEGDDTYIADYFAQGASYYYALGILNDKAGNDRYISGRYSQGAGIHSSVGILLDQKGDDFYYASYGVAQGMGHDYGVGYLEDSHGKDRYLGGTLVQGAATHGGIGILIDLKGQDSYTCNNNGQAFAQDTDSLGILIDTEPDRDISSQHKTQESIRLGRKK